MEKLSIFKRILLFTLSMLVGVIVFAVYTTYSAHNQIEQQFTRQAETAVKRFTEDLAGPYWLEEKSYLNTSLQIFKNLPDVVFLRIMNTNRERLGGYGDALYDGLIHSTADLPAGSWQSDSLLIVSQPIHYDGENHALFMAGFSKQKMNAEFMASLTKIAFLGAVLAMVMLLLGFALAYFTATPIRNAAEELAGHRLASSGMSVRLRESGGDEMQKLARSFNQMAESVETHIARLYNQPPELQLYFADNPVSMLITDPFWNIRSVNRAAMRLLERKEQTISGRSLEELLPSQDLDKLIKKVRGAPLDEQTLRISISISERMQTKDLELHTIALSDDGVIDAYLVVLRDLTQENNRETHFQEQLAQQKTTQKAIAKKYKHLKSTYEKQQHQLQRYLRLIRSAEKIVVLDSVEKIMETLVLEGSQLLGGQEGAVFVWDKETQRLMPFVPPHVKTVIRPGPLNESKGIVWNTFHSRQSQFIDSYHPASYAELGLPQKHRLALMAIPLVLNDESYGVAVYMRSQENFFNNEDEQFISLLIHSALVSLDRCKLLRTPVIPSDIRDRADARWESSYQDAFQQQKMESLEILVGGIAHDFNNILGIIMPNVDLLRIKYGKYPQVMKRVTAIQDAIKRAADLTRQLVVFTSSDTMTLKRVSPNRMIERLVTMLQRSFGEIIRIELNLETDVSAINADDTRLSQALINLAVNARDAMPKGGTLTIHSAQRHFLPPGESGDARPFVCISIEDTGTGIPEEHLFKVFDPFFSTKPPRQGAGMGLAVVHGIVKSHGGYVTVTSQVNRGSIFHIFLEPLTQTIAPEKQPELQKLPEPEIEQPATGSGREILIVDDVAQVLESLQESLEYLGHRVYPASGGREALRIIREKPGISVAIVDFAMPGMSGLETIQGLRQLRPDLKVVLSSGYPEQEKAVRNHRSIAAFLLKPYRLNQLTEVLETILADTSNPVKKPSGG